MYVYMCVCIHINICLYVHVYTLSQSIQICTYVTFTRVLIHTFARRSSPVDLFHPLTDSKNRPAGEIRLILLFRSSGVCLFVYMMHNMCVCVCVCVFQACRRDQADSLV
jgi:hypothetical protein